MERDLSYSYSWSAPCPIHLDRLVESTRGLTETLEGVWGDALEGALDGAMGLDASSGAAYTNGVDMDRRGRATVLNKLQCSKREIRRRGMRNVGDQSADNAYRIHLLTISKPPLLQFVLRPPMVLTNSLLEPVKYRFVVHDVAKEAGDDDMVCIEMHTPPL